MMSQQTRVSRLFVGNEDKGEGLGSRVKLRNDVELIDECTINCTFWELNCFVAVIHCRPLSGGERTRTFPYRMREVENETGRGCDGDSDFIGKKLGTVEGHETVYTESTSGEERPE